MIDILTVNHLSASRQGRRVIDDISISLKEGALTGLTGPNGGGKSTLFEVLLSEISPDAGQWSWARPVEISYLPQQQSLKKLLPVTVSQFVEMGLWGPKKKCTAALSFDETIQLLSLQEITDEKVGELSGGQLKRVLIARCLVQAADIYLLDEPFNHLDLHIEEILGHQIQDIARSKGKTFFVISHDWHAMDHFMDHLILLNTKVLASGSVRDVSQVYSNWRDPRHHKWLHGDSNL